MFPATICMMRYAVQFFDRRKDGRARQPATLIAGIMHARINSFLSACHEAVMRRPLAAHVACRKKSAKHAVDMPVAAKAMPSKRLSGL